MTKLDRQVEYLNTINDIAEMEAQMATFTLLCVATSNLIIPGKVWVPLHRELESALGLVDKKTFIVELERAFWILANWGLDNSASQGLWKDIVTKCKRRSHEV